MAALPTLGENLTLTKDHPCDDNPRTAEAMINTAPPGHGSRLVRHFEDNPIMRACFRAVGGVPLGSDEKRTISATPATTQKSVRQSCC